MNCGGQCLIGQYLAAQNLDWNTNYEKFGDGELRIAVAGREPHTFGAALKRARKINAAD